MKVGDRIKDNDPRMGGRVLTICMVANSGDYVRARDSIGFERMYMAKRIHSDGKPRRTGFDLLKSEAALSADN